MDIRDIKGKIVKIGKTSITVKDENNKTRGIVKNILLFEDAPPRISYQFSKIIKEVGIWGNQKLIKNTIICEKELYLLKDTRRLSRWLDMTEKVEWIKDDDMTEYEREMAIYEKAQKAGINVIECELLS